MAETHFCEFCKTETPHWKTRSGSWFNWHCQRCGGKADDSPAMKEQQQAVEREQTIGKALLDAQLLDLSNQIDRYRKALQELSRMAANVSAADCNQELEFGRRVGFAEFVRTTVEEALR